MKTDQGVAGQIVAGERVAVSQGPHLVEGHVDGQDDASGAGLAGSGGQKGSLCVVPVEPDDVFVEMLVDLVQGCGVVEDDRVYASILGCRDP